MTDTSPEGDRRSRRAVWLRRAGVALVGLAAVRALLPTLLERGIPWMLERQVGLPARVGNVDLWLLSGSAALEDVVIGTRHDAGVEGPPDPERALARWDRVFANLEWTALLSGRLELAALEIDSPKVRVEREEDGRIDPLGPRPAEPGSEQTDTSEDGAWPLIVRQFALRGANVDLVTAREARPLAELGVEELVLEDIGVDGAHIALGGFALRGPMLRLERDWLLGDAAEGSVREVEPEGSASAADSDSGAPPSYEIDRVEIERASLALLTGAGPLDVAIGFLATEIAARPGHRFPIRVELGVEEGSLVLDGRLGLDPPAFAGSVQWQDLPVPPLSLLQTPELLPWLRSCRAGGDVQVDARLADAPGAPAGITLHGTASIDDLSFVDPESEELAIEWQSFSVVTRKAFYPLGGGSAQLEIEALRLIGPRAHYTNPPRALERLMAMLGAGGTEGIEGEEGVDDGPEEPVSTGSEESAEPPIVARIDRVEIREGRLGYRDLVVTPSVDVAIEDLSADAEGVRFPELTARSLRAGGIAPGPAPFTLRGTIAQDADDLEFSLERLALVPFDPFAAQAGYAIASGDTTLRTQLKRRGERYVVDNDLVLHDLRIDTRRDGDFEGRFGVSIDLALALMRDPNGEIELPLPLRWEGSLVDVDLATVLLAAVREAMTGAITSPLKAAGMLMGDGASGGLSFEPIACAPGSSEPMDPERIIALARLLGERSTLGLELTGQAGPADGASLAEAILAERAAAGDPLPDVEGSGFFARRRLAAALERRAKGEPDGLGPEDLVLLARMVDAVAVPAARFEQLASRRAAAVLDRLVAAGINGSRVGSLPPRLGAEPGVALGLGMAVPEVTAAGAR